MMIKLFWIGHRKVYYGLYQSVGPELQIVKFLLKLSQYIKTIPVICIRKDSFISLNFSIIRISAKEFLSGTLSISITNFGCKVSDFA